ARSACRLPWMSYRAATFTATFCPTSAARLSSSQSTLGLRPETRTRCVKSEAGFRLHLGSPFPTTAATRPPKLNKGGCVGMSAKWSRREFGKRAGTFAGAATFGLGAIDMIEACGQQAAPTTGNLKGNLEIFSWWTAGGEADGLNEMFKIYTQKYPDVK